MNELPEEGAVLDMLGRLWALDQGLHAVSKRMLRTLGVTGPQRVVLRIVGSTEGISPGDLARRIHDHPSTLTGVLRRLEAHGLLRRTADQRDGRRAHLALTPAGHRVNESKEGTAEAAVRAAIARMSESDVAGAGLFLKVLSEELDRIAHPVEPAGGAGP